ncbi:exonuclease domain-containing protein [Thermobifida cellulosilytica]|uniref:DNA polymerase III n=1 Tax=Thermobifida cellulosilytica TB100 TaxID=665004 RepID=A0A147KDD6_THECS|nr:exonuclease domain-containing protein [Thermobifida cellulosilytica]KUP95311.1 DNA polymerase III [Thermobifida cellulosilytica TB100]
MGDSWTAIDFETANRDRGSVCAVGLVRVVDGRIVDRHTTLVRPPAPVAYFDRFNIEFHGITPEQVADAPEWPQVHATILEFADGGPFVAHNAAFDMGVIRAACAHTGLEGSPLDYACSLDTARRTWPELRDHRLPTVCRRIGHDLRRHHAADADAEAAAHIMLAAFREHGVATLPELCQRLRRPLRRAGASPVPQAAPAPLWSPGTRFDRWRREAAEPLPEPNPHADPGGPLYGKVVCVSGDLAALSKPEAWRRVAAAGGVPARNVTRRTDVLVVGDNGGVKTAKHRRAESYNASGSRIEIITEAELLARLAVGGGSGGVGAQRSEGR